ncbi:MAG: STAS domain-containing protein [Betaproteobacteria bacterium]
MLTIEQGEGDLVVIAGRFDAAQAPVAQKFLDRLGGSITLDCSQLDYVSSSGLGVLLKTQKRLLSAGGRLRLVGANRHILDIFQFSGFDKIFEIVPAGQ